MIVRSNDKAVEKELKALEKTIIHNGGWIHPGFVINYDSDGMGLSVFMEESCPPLDYIIKVPGDLLVPADSMRLAVKGSEFVVDPDTESLSSVQVEISRLMISIYNLTNKAAFHKNQCIWIRYRNAPELLSLLIQARSLSSNLHYRQSYIKGTDENITPDDFVVRTFTTSRIIKYKGYGDGQTRRVFMPAVDYMNHDYRGSMYNGEKAVNIHNSQPFVSSLECFTHYGMLDGLDMFICHNIYDQETPFIRSVPLVIPVEGVGEIVVHSYLEFSTDTVLPEHLSDLQSFMPSYSGMENGNVQLSHLFITVAQYPHVLRRILSIIINSFASRKLTREALIEQTRKAEEFILNENITFYQSMLNKLDAIADESHDLASQIRQVAELQLTKLYKYYIDDSFYDMDGNGNS